MQERKLEEKINDLHRVGSDIAEILFRYGVFNIKLKSASIKNVREVDDTLIVEGEVVVQIPHDEVRSRIMEVLGNVGRGNKGVDEVDSGDQG